VALKFYSSIYASDRLPLGWSPVKGGALKYPVRNSSVLRELRRLRAGNWKKVIKKGNTGEVHYFEHESGGVAGVKYFSGSDQT